MLEETFSSKNVPLEHQEIIINLIKGCQGEKTQRVLATQTMKLTTSYNDPKKIQIAQAAYYSATDKYYTSIGGHSTKSRDIDALKGIAQLTKEFNESSSWIIFQSKDPEIAKLAKIAKPTDKITTESSHLKASSHVDEPTTTPIDEPITTPIDEPITTPIDEPITTPIDEPITTPIDAPITASSSTKPPELDKDIVLTVIKPEIECDTTEFESWESELNRILEEALNSPEFLPNKKPEEQKANLTAQTTSPLRTENNFQGPKVLQEKAKPSTKRSQSGAQTKETPLPTDPATTTAGKAAKRNSDNAEITANKEAFKKTQERQDANILKKTTDRSKGIL
jgi:hypothetical protein